MVLGIRVYRFNSVLIFSAKQVSYQFELFLLLFLRLLSQSIIDFVGSVKTRFVIVMKLLCLIGIFTNSPVELRNKNPLN